jgi:hypothetical protein
MLPAPEQPGAMVCFSYLEKWDKSCFEIFSRIAASSADLRIGRPFSSRVGRAELYFADARCKKAGAALAATYRLGNFQVRWDFAPMECLRRHSA